MNGKPFSSQYAVHPHLRGAYAALPRQQLIFPGSSPHTWGIPLLGLRMLLPDRFIPTHVGHTQDRAGMSTPRSVHPHIRGAYVVHIRQLFRRDGSSPHTWGIQSGKRYRLHTLRFIPTYVGHTLFPMNVSISLPVHPHIRGAYWATVPALLSIFGSSPHTWGIQNFLNDVGSRVRFIPTYVGHTAPQVLGQSGLHGSSPHTWGIHGCYE